MTSEDQVVSAPPTFRVDVRTIRSGQPRAYADSFYEADLVFSNWWISTTGPRKGTWCPPEAVVRALAEILVRDFSDTPLLLDARLEKIERVAPDTWRVLIREPYCD